MIENNLKLLFLHKTIIRNNFKFLQKLTRIRHPQG